MVNPIIVNHFDPCSSINLVNRSPNLYARYEIIKKRIPLEIKLIKTNNKKLNPIRPLAIVNTL